MNVNKLSSYIAALFSNSRSLLPLLSTLVIIPLFTIGCTGSSQPDVYFPVQKEPRAEVLTALLPGKLVMVNGYLRVMDHLIIWPYGYSHKQEGKEIYIYDDEGQVVAQVGDIIQIGGGEIPTSAAEKIIGKQIPSDIEGPFWLAAKISVIKQ